MKKGFESINIHGCANAVIPVPSIGENGNWFIGNDDTEVCVRGDKGDKGENGEAGPQGLKGEQGDVGPAGAQGIQGIQGVQGEQGIKGEKGDTGEQGAQGLPGAQGVQGPKGDKGDIGPVGPQGEQGLKGTDADTTELELLNGDVVKVTESLNNVTGSVLWKNPNPTAAIFESKNIELSSSEYDFLEIFHDYGSERVLRGKTTQLKMLGTSEPNPGGGVATYFPAVKHRTITYVSDTKYLVGNCYQTASYNILKNNLLVPLYIIGYKSNIFK